MKYRRIFLIVLDSFGIGNAPDADRFNDTGADTLKSISSSPFVKIDSMKNLGLCNIDTVDYLKKVKSPLGKYGAITEFSAGKDTTTGHFEIAGIISKEPMPTFPHGFPDEVIKEFEKQTGCGVLCNKPYSGTKVIADYGEEHLKTGKLIVYTSADSVFQIAAHTDIVPLEKLYEYCRIARKILVGQYAVGRVIARPFNGEHPFVRTADRHDFSVEPPAETMLDKLKSNGYDVISVGKIADIFAHRGITEEFSSHSNAEGMNITRKMLEKNFKGLCFVNLVDFDMLYGHRRDVDGYAKAISEFDSWLNGFINHMNESDMLIITADHGCDPDYGGTDHTRERVPLLMYSKGIEPQNLGVLNGYNYISNVILDNFEIQGD
ncbi:MAG: phosphopentomutase [Candidatus Fimenecus sp.]